MFDKITVKFGDDAGKKTRLTYLELDGIHNRVQELLLIEYLNLGFPGIIAKKFADNLKLFPFNIMNLLVSKLVMYKLCSSSAECVDCLFQFDFSCLLIPCFL